MIFVSEKIQKKEIKENIIEVSQEVQVEIKNDLVILKKGNDVLEVPFNHVYVSVKYEDGKIIVTPNNKKKTYTSVSNTLRKIINNTLLGFEKDYVCKMAIVYSHFPITVSLEGDKFTIKNFYGEKKPRVLKVPKDVKIDVKGREIIISGKDKQKVGQAAGNIESRTRMKKKDYRVFDDGIYIVEKSK